MGGREGAGIAKVVGSAVPRSKRGEKNMYLRESRGNASPDDDGDERTWDVGTYIHTYIHTRLLGGGWL